MMATHDDEDDEGDPHAPSLALAETAFRDDVWLGANVLSKYTALEYFARSPFYAAPDRDEEYLIVEEQEPHLFVVRKQRVSTGRAICFFFVLDGLIFQAPPISAVLGARAARALHGVRDLFDVARRLHEPYDPGAHAQSRDNHTTADATTSSARPIEHVAATDTLVQSVVRKHAAMLSAAQAAPASEAKAPR